MSREENKSFWDEIQEKYEYERIRYTPSYHLNAGITITFEIREKGLRPNCPICNGSSNIHSYIPKTLTFGTINGAPANFEMKHCRYQCKKCRYAFMEEFAYLPDYRSLTQDAESRMGFHYGLNSIQACLYAHDRKQGYLKWKKYQRRNFREVSSAA